MLRTVSLFCVWGRLAIVVLTGLMIGGVPAGYATPPTGVDEDRPAPYLGPTALAVTRDGATLLVACADSRQVVWVNADTGETMRRVAVPGRPSDVLLTPDQSQVIVACAAPRSTIVFLDAVTGRLTREISAGHMSQALAIAPDGQRLYVCNRFDHDVTVFDVPTGRLCGRFAAGREPIAAAVTPNGQNVVVASHLPNMRTDISLVGDVSPIVTIVDTKTSQARQILLPSGGHGLRSVCVSPDGRLAFVTHLLANFQMPPTRVNTGWINSNVVSIIEIETGIVHATIGTDEMDRGMGNPWGIAFTADGETVCVSHAGTHELSYIPLDVLLSSEARGTMSPVMAAWPIYPNLGASLWRRSPLPGKGPRGLAAAGNRIFVAEYFSDTVGVVEFAEDESPNIRTLALGPAPILTTQRLGELLFHDATICDERWQSCASCHPDGRVDALNWDLLNDGMGNPKNTKSMLLAHQTPPVMATGVRETAELAVRAGIEHILFASRPEEEAEAIDAYLRSLEPLPSPHLRNGQFSDAARRGQRLFRSRRIACERCHPPPLYTDLRRHKTGVRGLFDKTSLFDTPTLVEVWRTAPYLHDGRYVTIRELLSEGRHGLRGKEPLSGREVDDLAEFVLSL